MTTLTVCGSAPSIVELQILLLNESQLALHRLRLLTAAIVSDDAIPASERRALIESIYEIADQLEDVVANLRKLS